MVSVSQPFETGSSGSNITPVNSGGTGVDAFDVVSTTATQVVRYSNEIVSHGVLSGEFSNFSSTTSGQAWAGYSTSIGSPERIYGRVYFRAAQINTTIFQSFFRAYNGASSRLQIGITVSGRIRVLDSNNSTATTAIQTTMVANQWYRIEWLINYSATAGSIEVRIYSDPESSTPAETLTAANQNFGGLATEYRFGMTSTISSSTAYYLDDIALDTAGWIGPYSDSGAGLPTDPRLYYSNGQWIGLSHAVRKDGQWHSSS